jgi:hypothetical protein
MDDLGPVLSTHKGRLAAGGYFWYLAALMTVFGGWSVVSAPFTGDWVRAGNGVTAVAVACVIVIYPAYRLLQTLTAHQNGFVWKRLLRAPVVVRWVDVANVRMLTEHNRRALHMKGTHVELDITLKSGEHVVVTNDLEGIEQIQGYLQRGAAAPAQTAGAWGAPPQPGAGGPPSPWGQP